MKYQKYFDSRTFAFNVSPLKKNYFSLEIDEMLDDVFSEGFEKFDVAKYNKSACHHAFFELKTGEITSMCLNSFLNSDFIAKNIEFENQKFHKIISQKEDSVSALYRKITNISKTEEPRVLIYHLSKYFIENRKNTENIIYKYLHNKEMQGINLEFKSYTQYSPFFRDEVIYFQSFGDVVKYDVMNTFKKNIKINICENCGQFFVPIRRSDEKYCNFNYLNGKSCKDVGYENKVNADDILKTYRTIYKTQNARKQRNKDSVTDIENKFHQWTIYAKEQLRLCKSGKIDLEQMKLNISRNDWLKNR